MTNEETKTEEKSVNKINIRDGKFIFELAFDKTPSVEELAAGIGGMFSAMATGIIQIEVLKRAVEDAQKEGSVNFKLEGFWDKTKTELDCGIYVGKKKTNIVKPHGSVIPAPFGKR